MATLTAEYLDDLGRIKLEAADLDPNVVYRIERSTDGGVTWVTVRGANNVTDGGVTVVYDYEYKPNIENRYRLIAPAISDTFERTVDPAGLVVDGALGSYASTPDDPVLDITGDIDIRVGVWRDDWSAPGNTQVMVAKYNDSENERSYRFTFEQGTGMLRLQWTDDGTSGTTHSELSDAGPADIIGTGPGFIALRVTRDESTGDVTFYHSTSFQDSSPRWEQLGSVQAGVTGPMYSGSADLEVGARDNGTQTVWNGTIIGVVIVDGIGGFGDLEVNFAKQPTGTMAFVDDTGFPWTVNGTAAIAGNDQAWGSADTGQLWNEHAGATHFPEGIWWVENGAGRVFNPESSFTGYSRYIDVDLADLEATYQFVMPSIAGVANDEGEMTLMLRGTAASEFDGYLITVWVEASTRRATLDISGAGTFTEVELPTWQPGQTWQVRARVVGTVIEARAWNTANPEPTTWQAVATSTNWASGNVGLATQGLTNDSYTAIFDNVLVYTVPPTAAATATVTPEQDDVLLKSIQFPSLNRNLGCIFTGERSRRSRVGLFDVKGRHPVLAIFDVGSTETMAIQFITTSVAENKAITALLTWGGPLLLQSPPDDDPTGCGDIAAYPEGWFAPGDNVQARPLPGRRGWQWTVPLTRIAVPSPSGILPAHMTWDVLWQITNTWVEVWDTWATWAELWDASVAPGTMIDALNE